MRLLHTTTFEFKEFYSDAIPRYAILSHRWGKIEEEVSYKQFRKGSVPPDLPGILKIQNFCSLVAPRFQWAWVDTCCIDKRSSAELSEAINSMYNWYERSEVCYVHLADVEFSARELWLKKYSGDAFWSTEDGWPSLEEKFRKSSWFERGWTLQELIAPNKVVFYDAYWNEIGLLDSFYTSVAQLTGIDRTWLAPNHRAPRSASVAARMSWASRRKTSRDEDLAYCLLGLFDVNMPLLYGEGGRKAFYRLQTEIMKISNDESLFAWTSDDEYSGLLAEHPAFFADSGDIVSASFGNKVDFRPPYSMTHRGLEMAVPKKHLQQTMQDHMLLFLRCLRGFDSIGIPNLEKEALYVQIYCWGNMSAVRTSCATLKEAKPSPDGSHYSIDQLDNDLKYTEQIYIRQLRHG